MKLVGPLDLAELTISSEVLVSDGTSPKGAYSLEGVEGVSVEIRDAEGSKCGRCWQYSDEVGSSATHPELCGRCFSVIEKQVETAS